MGHTYTGNRRIEVSIIFYRNYIASGSRIDFFGFLVVLGEGAFSAYA